MEVVQAAERDLASQLLFFGRAVDAVGEHQKLQFTEEEEQAVEDRLNDAVAAFKKALQNADEWLLEVTDPQVKKSASEQLSNSKGKLQTHIVGMRKVLVAYRQKAKTERVNHQRASLMEKARSKTSSGSAVDVTAALKRTHRKMAEEVDRVTTVSQVLDDGRVSLKSSRQEFDSVNAELIEVRKRLKALQWQARQDRMWIAAGISLLATTVLYIMHQRTGLLII